MKLSCCRCDQVFSVCIIWELGFSLFSLNHIHFHLNHFRSVLAGYASWRAGSTVDIGSLQWMVTLPMDSLPLLYHSSNFLVINKFFDVKINSDDPEDTVTIATLLHLSYPAFLDKSIKHGYR